MAQAYRNHQAQVTTAQMRDVIGASGLPCDSLHGIFGEEFDPSNPDETGRRFAVDTFKAEADFQEMVEKGHEPERRKYGVATPEETRRTRLVILIAVALVIAAVATVLRILY